MTKEEARMGDTDHTYALAQGKHRNPDDGRCAMEWVAYLAGEPHSDEPVCVSPFLRDLLVAANDAMTYEDRQQLRPYLARCIGTRGDGLDRARRKAVARFVKANPTGEALSDCYCGSCLARRPVADLLRLLDELLPTVPLQVPVADDIALVCGLR